MLYDYLLWEGGRGWETGWLPGGTGNTGVWPWSTLAPCIRWGGGQYSTTLMPTREFGPYDWASIVSRETSRSTTHKINYMYNRIYFLWFTSWFVKYYIYHFIQFYFRKEIWSPQDKNNASYFFHNEIEKSKMKIHIYA